eukprot:13631033-Alexandrium_andersonii.AAC.1
MIAAGMRGASMEVRAGGSGVLARSMSFRVPGLFRAYSGWGAHLSLAACCCGVASLMAVRWLGGAQRGASWVAVW